MFRLWPECGYLLEGLSLFMDRGPAILLLVPGTCAAAASALSTARMRLVAFQLDLDVSVNDVLFTRSR